MILIISAVDQNSQTILLILDRELWQSKEKEKMLKEKEKMIKEKEKMLKDRIRSLRGSSKK